MPTVTGRSSVYRRALQIDLLGVVGGFALVVPAVVSSLPRDLKRFSPTDWNGSYTVLSIAKYGYVLWFAAYFFLGRVSRERAKDREESLTVGSGAFDFLQIAGGFTVAHYLGFFGRAADPGRAGFLVMAIVILVISALSLLFRDSDSKEKPPTLVHVRIGGCVASMLAIVTIATVASDAGMAAAVAVALTLHAALLGRFAFLQRAREQRATVAAASQLASDTATTLGIVVPPSDVPVKESASVLAPTPPRLDDLKVQKELVEEKAEVAQPVPTPPEPDEVPPSNTKPPPTSAA